MKLLDIALKDMMRSFRSAFALVFMFVMPLLTAGIFHFAFGGMTGDGGFDIPSTRVALVNLDQAPAGMGSFLAGQVLTDFLQDEELSDLLDVQVMPDEATARAAVAAQEAGVAIIIPPDLSSATLDPQRHAEVVLVQDPTLTLGPAIVMGLVSQFVDGFAGTAIAASVTAEQLAAQGVDAEPRLAQQVMLEYATWAQGQAQTSNLAIQAPTGATQSGSQNGDGYQIMASVLSGMMIFFAFFTGASTAQTIITEDEEGTLSRLFTTPTPIASILGGKLLAVVITLAVQIVVTVAAGRVIFGIRWGGLLPLMMAALALVATAAGLGVFMMSLIKTSRQAGPMMGGVLTITGMAGGLMTTGIPNMPAAFDTLTLFFPQGWALRAFETTLAGGAAADVLLPLAVSLGMGGALFVVGVLFFRKRFA